MPLSSCHWAHSAEQAPLSALIGSALISCHRAFQQSKLCFRALWPPPAPSCWFAGCRSTPLACTPLHAAVNMSASASAKTAAAAAPLALRCGRNRLECVETSVPCATEAAGRQHFKRSLRLRAER
jgi:hypothetical protein